ncbi:MAG: glycine--tRNA ligase subunit beta [Gaiellaceae bacterium]
MPTLLLEIGCEELPASACREAAAQLPDLAREKLGREPDELFVGPRRLAILIRDFDPEPPKAWVQGPPVAIAFDDKGEPTRAAIGFGRRYGVAEESLREALIVRGEVVGVEVEAERLELRLAAVVRGLGFGKSMTWPGAPMRFSRPLRWLVALLDQVPLAVALDGIAAGTVSQAHRFVAPRPSVMVPTAEAYAETLRANGVEPSSDERRRLIVAGLDALGAWQDPLAKLDEVVYLVEHPMVLEGSYDERYLALPERVVTTAMQSHQRYFPLEGARFAFVANAGEPELVRAGNERVLEGRLEDASFTFERDVARGIDALAGELGSITFLAGAGSFAEKAQRLVELVRRLGGDEEALEAARLAKADQAAELVREFPDLEGHIGAEYARLAGYSDAVCAAIEEQYLPDAAGGPLPATRAGRLLAAADKLDNLKVAFELGRKPSGSRDPFGLRRAAIGLCRLAIEGGVEVDLGLLPADAAEFVEERLEGVLGLPVEVVRAVRGSTVEELGALARLAQALAALGEEELGKLHTAYTRAERIAGKHEGLGPLDAGLLEEAAERDLAQLVGELRPEIAALLARRELESALRAGTRLGDPLERFFTDVLVMAEDERVRANRLRLLLDARDTLRQLADFSLLQI